MPLTYSGRSVTAENDQTPSLRDLAIGMSRQPRWSGQTRRWFSVLDHTLFGDDLLWTVDSEPKLRLAWLLHDAHEALTGDVPTPFKGPELRKIQDSLDRRIAEAFFPGGPPEWARWRAPVKDIDRRTLRAEVLLVGPPSSNDHYQMFDITGFNRVSVDKDVGILRRALGRGKYLGLPPITYPLMPDQHAGVQEFLSRMLELL